MEEEMAVVDAMTQLRYTFEEPSSIEPEIDEEEPIKSFTKKKKRSSLAHGSSKKRQALGRFSFFRDAGEEGLAGFMYRKITLLDIPMLADGEGLEFLHKVSLQEFAHEQIPHLNKSMCDEFIASFNIKTSTGRVRGFSVKLDRYTVAEATKLPVGETDIRVTAQDKNVLKRMGFVPKVKTLRGYSVEHLVYEEKPHVFATVASMLMIKLENRKECFHFISPEVLVALDKAYRLNADVDWAGYLCKLITKSVTSNRIFLFAYGEWLTRIIEQAMSKEAGKEHKEGVEEQSGEAQDEGEHKEGNKQLWEVREGTENSLQSKSVDQDLNEEQPGMRLLLEGPRSLTQSVEKYQRVIAEMMMEKMRQDKVIAELRSSLENKEQEMRKNREEAVEVITLAKSAYIELRNENTQLKKSGCLNKRYSI